MICLVEIVKNTFDFEKELNRFCGKYENSHVKSFHFHYSGKKNVLRIYYNFVNKDMVLTMEL